MRSLKEIAQFDAVITMPGGQLARHIVIAGSTGTVHGRVATAFYRLAGNTDDSAIRAQANRAFSFTEELRLLNNAWAVSDHERHEDAMFIETKLREAYGPSAEVVVTPREA